MWAYGVVDEKSGYIGWRCDISAEKSVQELKGQMSVSPLARCQLPSLTQSSTYMCCRSESNVCNGRYLYRQLLCKFLLASCNAYRLAILSLPSFASRYRLVKGLT